MRSRGHWPTLEAAAVRLAWTGENGLVWHAIAAGGLLLHRRGRPHYRRAMWIVLATLLANTAVKQTVRRARPVLEEEFPALVPVISGRSYPSAHSSTSFAGARALGLALPRPPLYALAAAMALTRPYLGVHYPSDILAGAVLGDAFARLATP